ncbi:MAG: Co2+/Mg2+ efflux protein ApaG [Acidobacteriota bacterium]
MSDTVTQGIRIEVEASFEPDHSKPPEQFLFSYRVRISNLGDQTVRLISRRWVITDGEGRQQVVEGAGVVGQQPTLEPGESFEYSSFCPLETAVGWMEGSYWMEISSEESFEAEIGRFTLAAPNAVN